jgi:hypothetical protein
MNGGVLTAAGSMLNRIFLKSGLQMDPVNSGQLKTLETDLFHRSLPVKIFI